MELWHYGIWALWHYDMMALNPLYLFTMDSDWPFGPWSLKMSWLHCPRTLFLWRCNRNPYTGRLMADPWPGPPPPSPSVPICPRAPGGCIKPRKRHPKMHARICLAFWYDFWWFQARFLTFFFVNARFCVGEISKPANLRIIYEQPIWTQGPDLEQYIKHRSNIHSKSIAEKEQMFIYF